MSIVAYKNKNTGQVVAYPEANSRLEMLGEWERTGSENVSYAVADAHDRAAAERQSIEAAAAIRLDSAVGAAAYGIAAAEAVNTGPSTGSVPAALPTLSTSSAGETQNLVSLLDKGDLSRAAATTSFEENKRLADEELLHPPTDGVLARAKRDHKTGATQIGPNPEDHPGPAAAAAAGLTPESSPAEAGVVSTPGTPTGTTTDGSGLTDTATTAGTDAGTGDGAGTVGPPAHSANKPEWVDYAVAHKGVDRESAEAKTKQQLVDEYGS